jgi:hypothetical protein
MNQEEIEFFEYLSRNLITTKKTIKEGVEVDLDILGDFDFLDEIKTKHEYKEEVTIITAREVVMLIKQFCKSVSKKYDVVKHPSHFINKWGLVHLSVYKKRIDVFIALSNVEGVDMFKQFSTDGLSEVLVMDKQINLKTKKLNTRSTVITLKEKIALKEKNEIVLKNLNNELKKARHILLYLKFVASAEEEGIEVKEEVKEQLEKWGLPTEGELTLQERLLFGERIVKFEPRIDELITLIIHFDTKILRLKVDINEEQQQKKELPKQIEELIQKENVINPESLLSKYRRYDTETGKHVDYYVFEFGLWKEFTKKQGKKPVYMNYDLWIFGATPFHFIEKYIIDDPDMKRLWRLVVLRGKSREQLLGEMYTSKKIRRDPRNAEKWQTLFRVK